MEGDVSNHRCSGLSGLRKWSPIPEFELALAYRVPSSIPAFRKIPAFRAARGTQPGEEDGILQLSRKEPFLGQL
jgi:hypothetical protein